MSQHLRATIYLVVATNHKQPFTNGSTNPHLSLTTRGCGDYWLIFRSVLLSPNFAQCHMRQQFASSLKCMSTLKGTSHIFPYFPSFGDTSCLSLEFSGTTQHSSCGVQSTNNVDIFKKKTAIVSPSTNHDPEACFVLLFSWQATPAEHSFHVAHWKTGPEFGREEIVLDGGFKKIWCAHFFWNDVLLLCLPL